MQHKAVRSGSGATYNEHTDLIFRKQNTLQLEDLYDLNVVNYMYQDIHSRTTRNRLHPHIIIILLVKASVIIVRKSGIIFQLKYKI